MGGSLDSILNVLIPAGIFIFIAFLIYSKAKKPIDSFFATVKGWFQNGDEEGGGSSGGYPENEVWNHKIKYQGEEI